MRRNLLLTCLLPFVAVAVYGIPHYEFVKLPSEPLIRIGLATNAGSVTISTGDSSLVAIPVGRVRRVVCASPRYLQRHGTPREPADVRQHRCVRFSAVSEEHGWKFFVGRRSVIVPVKVAFSTNQVDVAVDMCVSGLGLGMFLSYQVAPYLGRKALRYVLESFEPEPLPVNVVYPHARLQSTRVRAFVDQCVETLRKARLA